MKLGWGIVGYGWVARDHMAPAIMDAGHRLAAVSDPSPDARAAAAAAGARAYAELSEMLADPGVDAVYVATPNHLHRQAVEAAARAGKPVLCEKPMAVTLADAQAMAAACRRANVVYGTAFDQRRHPAHRRIRECLAAGAVGRVTAVRIVYACWVDPAWTKGASDDNWRADPVRAGGGAMMDLAPHGLDLIEFLLDEPIAEVRALTHRRVQAYAVDDGAVLAGLTESGVLFTLHVAYNCPEALPRRRLEVVGDQAMITAVNTMGQDAGGRVVRTDGRTGRVEPVEVPGSKASPFLNQVKAFAEAVRTGGGDYSLERDLRIMRLTEEAYGRARPEREPVPCP